VNVTAADAAAAAAAAAATAPFQYRAKTQHAIICIEA
jgi:hypothetical protein